MPRGLFGGDSLSRSLKGSGESHILFKLFNREFPKGSMQLYSRYMGISVATIS